MTTEPNDPTSDDALPAPTELPTGPLVPIDSIERHPRNPNRGDVPTIIESIAHNGFFGGPIVQTSRRRVLAGEHRWRALRQLQHDGFKPPGGKHVSYEQLAERVVLPPAGFVPVQWFDCDDDTGLRVMLADNESAKRATYDEPILSEILSELRESDALDGSAFRPGDVDDLIAKLRVPDLADLATKLGEPSVSDFWPVVRLKVHPDTLALWNEVVARLAGPDAGDDDAMRAVLRALPS